MPIYMPYLVFGTVLDSIGDVVPNAKIEVTTSIKTRNYTSDTNGIYLFNLADIGYTSGETVPVKVVGPFDNELLDFTFVVEGFWREADINLAIRTAVENITGYPILSVLHSVGKKPITTDNALPVQDNVDLLRGYALAGGDDDNRIFGYVKKNGEWYIQKFDKATKQYLYIKGKSGFITNWNGRTSLTYLIFNEVFG